VLNAEMVTRYSFSLCNCNPAHPHGYFRDPVGARTHSEGIMFKGHARHVLDDAISTGLVPSDQRDLILADIEATELPDEPDSN
jgi:hypothetical protein